MPCRGCSPAPSPTPPPSRTPKSPRPPAKEAPPAEAIANLILGDLQQTQEAEKQWAEAKGKTGKVKVQFNFLLPYLPADSAVVTGHGKDRLGNPIDFGTLETGPHVSAATVKALSVGDDFWGPFAPLPTKQELAQDTLAELRQIRLAILNWDAANGSANTEPVEFAALKGYLPEASDLWKREGEDRLGNPYLLGPPSDPVHISPETAKTLAVGASFWGEFAPKGGVASKAVHHTRQYQERRRSFGSRIKEFFIGR